MARYTLNLNEIIETLLNEDTRDITYNPYDYIDEMTERAVPVVFSSKYKVYDNDTDRMELLKKILKHYWDYEITTFTPYDFIFKINEKMSEIMPYYNQLYDSALLEFDPFNDVDYSRHTVTDDTSKTTDDGKASNMKTGQDTDLTTHSGSVEVTTDRDGKDITTEENDGDDTTTREVTESKSEGTKWHYENDTPQGSISGITELDYLSKYTKDTDETEGSSKAKDVTEYGRSTTSTTEYGSGVDEKTTFGNSDHTTTTYGNMTNSKTDNTRDFKYDGDKTEDVKGKMSNVSYSARLLEFRQTILNIDAMIIKDLHELFFKIA